MPKQVVTDFPWNLLKRVSRSFYLTLRLLPSPVREPISLAYLLARLSDTEADGAASDAEKDLLTQKTQVLALLEGHPMRTQIEAVWSTIREGQQFDQVRFHPPPRPALTPQELDRYTYLVAGCVGEFWTHVCKQKLPKFSARPVSELLPLAVRFGKALQLVNILRDRAADAVEGRVYVQRKDVGEVLTATRCHLKAAREYCSAIRPWRLRAACLLPVLVARETLVLIERNPDQERVKVSRGRMRILLFQCMALPLLQKFSRSK